MYSHCFFQGLLTVSYIALLSNVGENMAAKLKIRLFDSLLRQDIKFFDKHKTGELVDRWVLVAGILYIILGIIPGKCISHFEIKLNYRIVCFLKRIVFVIMVSHRDNYLVL